MTFSRISLVSIMAIFMSLAGCAVKESHRTIESESVESRYTPYSGEKNNIVVGKFQNRSTYLRGIFSDGHDRLGDQARTILKTHLQQTNRFYLLDRTDMGFLAQESNYSGVEQAVEGAKYAIVGGVTEFGRRSTSDQQLFGIVGSGKRQFAYTKVMLNVVDVRTSKVVYSAVGAGEYQLSSRQVAGFGTRAGYDETLNGKVLDLAVREAVNDLVLGLENRAWVLD